MNKFISYGQNHEDVILNRVFGSKNKGLYIDIGANHPIIDSITYAHYLKGWSGLNVEPVKELFDEICMVRKRDINVNMAVSNINDERMIYVIRESGLSTLEIDLAKEHARMTKIEIRTTRTIRLDKLCDSQGICDVDYMIVDVEGHELEVLESNDWEKVRPRIIIIESVKPNTNTWIGRDCYDLLISKSYSKILFDGINDFYLANECNSWTSKINYPVNVLDNYIPIKYVR